MRRWKQGLIALGVVCGVFSVGAYFAPPGWTHSSAAAFTSTRCLEGDGWAATLHITATNPELGPVATIVNPASTYSVPVPAGGYTKEMTTVASTLTVSVTLKWSDGFSQNLGSYTANRPGGCTTTTTQPATTTTTTCEQAIPPRSDCGGATTSTTSTTSTPPPDSAPSTAPPATSVMTGPSDSPPSSTGSSTRLTPSTTPRPTALPATGGNPWWLVAIAVGSFVIGAAIVLLVGRRVN